MTHVSEERLRERSATFTCDDSEVGPLYYFKVTDRAPGPYKKQLRVEAIIDVADDGTLAGVELIEYMPPPPLSLRSYAHTSGEVKVKPLEWEDAGEEEWTAESLCGSYYLPLIGSRYNVLLNCAGNGGMFQTRLAEALDIDEAKAFCEADNRTRILGELDTKP